MTASGREVWLGVTLRPIASATCCWISLADPVLGTAPIGDENTENKKKIDRIDTVLCFVSGVSSSMVPSQLDLKKSYCYG